MAMKNCKYALLTRLALANRWSLVSHMVSVRPSWKKRHANKHATTLHGPWWVTKLPRLVDPRGWPTVTTAGSDHYCLSVHPSERLYVHPNFSKYRKAKQLSNATSDRYWRDCGSGQVDHWWHTCLVMSFYWSSMTNRCSTAVQHWQQRVAELAEEPKKSWSVEPLAKPAKVY